MREEPSISLADIAEAIGMSLSGVEKAVRNMKASGEIERKNGKKGGSWRKCFDELLFPEQYHRYIR